jgi:hypothetical protein
VGEIVDYMPRDDRDGFEVDVCIKFEGAKVDVVSLPSELLSSRSVEITLGNLLVAEIDTEADSQFWMQISSIEPVTFNMEEVYKWR